MHPHAPRGRRRRRRRLRANVHHGPPQERSNVPTYLAPGVVFEEISSGSRPIAPVATSTSALIGAARKVPVNRATLVTSAAEFEKVFGTPYRVTPTDAHYLAYAVRHFFEQGGSRCYVV